MPGRRGFTLPEVSIALMIIAVTCIAFCSAFTAGRRAISRGRHIDQASDNCQEQLEFYRQVGYGSLPITAAQVSTQTSFTPNSSLPNASGSVTLTRVDDTFAAVTTDTGKIKVEATVTWSGIGADRGTVTVTGIVVR